VTTLAGGGAASGFSDATGTSARFKQPNGVALSSDGATLYVSDYGNNRIRAVVTGTGAVTTLSGTGSAGSVDGAAAVATFNSPSGLALKSDNSLLYVADRFSHKIRTVATTGGVASTLSGDGNAASDDGLKAIASFHYPRAIVLNSDETVLYVAETHSHKIRSVDTASGTVTTLCGDGNIGSDDGACASASFNYPFGIAYFLDPISLSGFVYVSDLYNHKVRKIIVSSTPTASTLAGDGVAGSDDGAGSTASLNQPTGLAVSNDGSKLYVSMLGGNTIRAVATSTGSVKTIAGNGVSANQDGTTVTASLNMPMDLVFTNEDTKLYIAGGLADHSIRVVNYATPPVVPPPFSPPAPPPSPPPPSPPP